MLIGMFLCLGSFDALVAYIEKEILDTNVPQDEKLHQ